MSTKRKSHSKSKYLGAVGSKLKDALQAMIVDLLAMRKISKITKELDKDQKVKNSVEAMHQAYERMDKTIDEFCTKYPEECQRIKDEIENS